jgi:hypothetical protein
VATRVERGREKEISGIGENGRDEGGRKVEKEWRTKEQ